jgi:formylglycine-generating enzyme required for sulfatase activity
LLRAGGATGLLLVLLLLGWLSFGGRWGRGTDSAGSSGPTALDERPPNRQPQPPALAKEITNSIGMKLVLIPSGKFTMGSPEKEEGHFDNEVEHEVTITRPFYLGKYPVTQGEYEKVMGTNPSWFSPTGGGKDKVKDRDTGRFPVETVSWYEAAAFCNRLSQKEGIPEAEWCYLPNGQGEYAEGMRLAPDYRTRRGYRLPTEAEWEYACRAGTRTAYHFGDDPKQLGDYAWFNGNSGWRTHRVGQKKPNAWGLFDMHGNVWQWCQDWYGPYDLDKRTDPEGPKTGERRVLRGGSWYDGPRICRAALRYHSAPGYRVNAIVFRVLCVSRP